MTSNRLLVSILILMALLAGAAPAQRSEDSATRSVQGIVTNSANAPVEGAVVQLKDTKTLQIRSFRTQADGAYHFYGLSTSVEYELKANFQDSASSTKTLSVFDGRKTANVNLKLDRKS